MQYELGSTLRGLLIRQARLLENISSEFSSADLKRIHELRVAIDDLFEFVEQCEKARDEIEDDGIQVTTISGNINIYL